MEIVAAAPDEFRRHELDVFMTLVQRGGEVGGRALATNTGTAKVLVFGRDAGEVIGVAALKRPQAAYRKRIGGKADVEIDSAAYPFELGYVYLLPEMRGKKLARRLVAAALHHAEGAGVFATARTDNAPMLATLANVGFVTAGQEYRGLGERMIRLLVRATG